MATFRIWQKVRLVKHSDGAQFRVAIGTEAFIVKIGCIGVTRSGERKATDYGCVTMTGFRFCCYGWQLEPLYDGNTTVSWESCEWQPNKVSA